MNSNTKIRGAFYWFNDKKPSVAYMLVDENGYKPIREAQHISLNILNFDKQAKDAIDKYFNLIDIELTKDRDVKLKHKIVSHGAPILLHYKKTKPSDKTSFIDEYYKAKLEILGIGSKQIKTPLDGESLKKFKRYLFDLLLLKTESGRSEAFKHRLWAIVLEVTNKNYEQKLRPLWEQIRKPEGIKKEKKRQYIEWIHNH